MRYPKAILIWLFLIFIGIPLALSLCLYLYVENNNFLISLGEGFIKYYIGLTILLAFFRLIAKLTDKGERDE